MIVNLVSTALADADTSQTGPARTFLRLLSQEATTAGCGVLLVAHDTKSARNLAMAGHKTPGPGPSPVPRLDALARRVEFIDGSDGEPEIPTVEALAAYLPMAPETAQKEAGELLEQLPWPRMILDGILVNNDDLEHARWRAQAPPTPADGRRVGVSDCGPQRLLSTIPLHHLLPLSLGRLGSW